MRMKIPLKKSAFLLLIFAIPLILVAGLRPVGIDGDSLNYASMLDISIRDANFFDKEPLFWLLIYFNQMLFSGYSQTFFFAFALIGVTLKLRAINRLSLSPVLSLITYLSLYYVLHEMTQIRAGIATAIFLLAIPDVVTRNLKNFLAKTFIACLFHYSALLMLVVYLFKPNTLNKGIYLSLPLIGILLSFQNSLTRKFADTVINLFPDTISGKLNIYVLLIDEGKFSDINIFNFYYASLLILYLVLVVNYKKLRSEYDVLLLKIFGMALFLFYGLSSVPVWAFRISEYFFVVLIILIPHVLCIFKQKSIVVIAIVGWLVTYFFAIMVGNNLTI